MIKQSFKSVLIKLIASDYELTREGHETNDIIPADREYINGVAKSSVWFNSKSNSNNCVAYLGSNAELVDVLKNK